jgi:hypothetical protein
MAGPSPGFAAGARNGEDGSPEVRLLVSTGRERASPPTCSAGLFMTQTGPPAHNQKGTDANDPSHTTHYTGGFK